MENRTHCAIQLQHTLRVLRLENQIQPQNVAKGELNVRFTTR